MQHEDVVVVQGSEEMCGVLCFAFGFFARRTYSVKCVILTKRQYSILDAQRLERIDDNPFRLYGMTRELSKEEAQISYGFRWTKITRRYGAGDWEILQSFC